MRILPRFTIPAGHRPGARGLGAGQLDPARAVRLRWMGTAGYEIKAGKTTLLIDPFVSRPGVLKLLSLQKLRPEEPVLARYFPEADYILTGHSHYDHAMDVPEIAARTGASVVGSASTCTVARCRGIPAERCIEIPESGARHTLGEFEIRFVPSKHGRFFFGRVPADGVIHGCSEDGHLPAHGYRMGGAFGIWLKVGDLTLYHNGSADLIDAELEGLNADVVIMGLAGRFATPDYIPRLSGLLRPKWIVPTHYDSFFHPLEEGLTLLPAINLRGFFRRSEAAAPAAEIVMPAYGEDLYFPLG